MAKIEWDKTGERFYETGVEKGVLYPQDTSGKYPKGVAWNGLTGVTETPSGAEATKLYADNRVYGVLRSAEEFGGTIEAYMCPDEFYACDGSAELGTGVRVGQQKRTAFGLSYVTKVGNDITDDAGYRIHLVYNATVSPSERAYATVNDSPEAITLSWTFETTQVNVSGMNPTSIITIDSNDVASEKLKTIEDLLYGTESKEATLPDPDTIKSILDGTYSAG